MEHARYGVDVALRRADDLDRKTITYIQESSATSCVSVLDLGCGGGGQSVRMAEANAKVLGVDVGEYFESFETLRAQHSISEASLQFIQGDVRTLDSLLCQQPYDVCVMQRVLHYVPYADALKVLSCVRGRMKKEGKLYIAVTGIESDIGRAYQDTSKPVQERFCQLDDVDAKTFSMYEPVCLYTPEECMILLQDSGWKIEEYWISAFGNIKAVCT